MTITASGLYGLTREKQGTDTLGQSLEAETHKALLVTDTYTPNYDTHEFRSEVTNEVPGTGNYTTGGNTITATKFVVGSPASGQMRWDFADPTWPSSTITDAMALIPYFNVGTAGTDALIGLADFVTAVSTVNGLLTVQIAANGFFYRTHAVAPWPSVTVKATLKATDDYDGGCCYLPGDTQPGQTKQPPCPFRWYIAPDESIWQRDDADPSGRVQVGTLTSVIDDLFNGKPKKDRAREQVQGTKYACSLLVNLIGDDGNLITGANWEANLDAAWSSAFDPGQPGKAIGDTWVANGKPRSYCVTYDLPTEQCCFGEDAATNAARLANCSVTRVAVAQRNGV